MAHRHGRSGGSSAEEHAINGWLEPENHFMDLSPTTEPSPQGHSSEVEPGSDPYALAISGDSVQR